MALTTLAIVKARCEITSDKHDMAITQIIDGLSMAFANATNRVVNGMALLERQADYVGYFDGGATFISLPLYPVEEISEVKESYVRNFDVVDALTDNTDYVLRPGTNILYRQPDGVRWMVGIATNRVTWTGGYVAAGEPAGEGQTAMPADLIEAATIQAVHLFKNRDRLGLKTFSAGSGTISITSDDLLPIVRRTLAHYKRY